ncbi:MAG: hypothetical protein KDA22_03020 [Phycisphaerales bacterium]|nr:hypothetical protein [Phycisphaerales bacterium]
MEKPLKSPRIMLIYAIFLVACGVAAFAMSGFDARARTALIAGGGAAAVMAGCAFMAAQLQRSRAVGMTGIHLGLIAPMVFAGLFLWRGLEAYVSYKAGVPPLEALVAAHNAIPGADPISVRPLYLPIVLALMATVSAMVFGMLLMTRPPKEERA